MSSAEDTDEFKGPDRRLQSVTGGGTDARVLCVDDDEAVAEITAELLEREANEVTTTVVTDPRTALDRIEAEQFDCVVSDYDMPRMDGLALLERLRSFDEGMPFVLFTGQGSEDIASEAISAGVTEYLQKGAGTDQYTVLANRVEQAVTRRQTERELAVERTRREGLFTDNPNPVVEGEFDPDDEGSPEPVIRDVNPAFERVFGVDREAVRGERIDDVVPAPESDAPVVSRERVNDAAIDGEPLQVEARRAAADGPRDFLVTLIPLSPPAGPERGYAVYTDITDRKRRERRIDRLARESEGLLRADTREVAARRAIELVEECFGLRLAGVHFRDGDALVPAVVSDTTSEMHDPVPTYRRDRSEPADRLVWDVFDSGEARVVSETAVVRESSIASCGVVYPLGEHGVLIAADDDPDVDDDTTTSLLDIVATNLTAALDRIERERTTATLQTAAREIGAAEALGTACRRTTEAAEELLEFQYCSVDVAVGDRFVPIVVTEGLDETDVELFDADEGLIGASYRHGETYVVGDCESHEYAEPKQEMVQSAVSVPIGDHGVMQAVADEPHAYDDRDGERAESLVAHLAATLDRLRDGPDAPVPIEAVPPAFRNSLVGESVIRAGDTTPESAHPDE